MKSAILVNIFLFVSVFAFAQDSLHSGVPSHVLFGVFPLNINKRVVYEQSFPITNQKERNQIFKRARSFFKKKDETKYAFDSENDEGTELVYQGGIKDFETKEIYFNLIITLNDSSCTYTLTDIVSASGNYKKSKVWGEGSGFSFNGGAMSINTSPTAKLDENATALENINIEKQPYNGSFCKDLDQRFRDILDHLGNALRNQKKASTNQ